MEAFTSRVHDRNEGEAGATTRISRESSSDFWKFSNGAASKINSYSFIRLYDNGGRRVKLRDRASRLFVRTNPFQPC